MDHSLFDFETSLASNKKNESKSFEEILFNNKNNSGFLYQKPNVQHKSIIESIQSYLPDDPYIISYLIHRSEIQWAKLFPLRLYLRLGEQLKGI